MCDLLLFKLVAVAVVIPEKPLFIRKVDIWHTPPLFPFPFLVPIAFPSCNHSLPGFLSKGETADRFTEWLRCHLQLQQSHGWGAEVHGYAWDSGCRTQILPVPAATAASLLLASRYVGKAWRLTPSALVAGAAVDLALLASRLALQVIFLTVYGGDAVHYTNVCLCISPSFNCLFLCLSAAFKTRIKHCLVSAT